MHKTWIFAAAFSLFLAAATVASAQSTTVTAQGAAGQVTQGQLISLGTTSLQSPKMGTSAIRVAHSTPTQIINEPALIKLMYQANANVPMPNIVESSGSPTSAPIGFGGSTFTVNGLSRQSRNVLIPAK